VSAFHRPYLAQGHQATPKFGSSNPENISNTFNSVGGDMTQFNVTSYEESGVYSPFYPALRVTLVPQESTSSTDTSSWRSYRPT
jgi:hypothetical protein